ncbi:MAG TPA: hypothetical protein VFB82_20720, partial [Blastocatellia bacterium]|nr:hypothetical protein [Blastocatellia bacterium]
MRRVLLTCILVLIGVSVLSINALQVQGPSQASSTASAGQGHTTGRDSPPDLNTYVRNAVPADYSARLSLAASFFFVRDTVVSNTDATLTNTDTFGDSEPTIAINPANPAEIVISAFSGSWGSPQANAPIWHSTDGGNTWTKQ